MYFPPQPLSALTLVSAAVSVVFPWSTCPMVPTFTWGFVRSNLALAMTPLPRSVPCWDGRTEVRKVVGGSRFSVNLPSFRPSVSLPLHLRHDLLRHVLGHFLVVVELHRVVGAPLGHAAELGGIPEHLGQRHVGGHHLGVAALGHPPHLAATAREIADHAAQA